MKDMKLCDFVVLFMADERKIVIILCENKHKNQIKSMITGMWELVEEVDFFK